RPTAIRSQEPLPASFSAWARAACPASLGALPRNRLTPPGLSLAQSPRLAPTRRQTAHARKTLPRFMSLPLPLGFTAMLSQPYPPQQLQRVRGRRDPRPQLVVEGQDRLALPLRTGGEALAEVDRLAGGGELGDLRQLQVVGRDRPQSALRQEMGEHPADGDLA